MDFYGIVKDFSNITCTHTVKAIDKNPHESKDILNKLLIKPALIYITQTRENSDDSAKQFLSFEETLAD